MTYPTEREIETVLVSHIHHNMPHTAVVGRQVRLPMGVLDLVLLQKLYKDDTQAYAVTVVEIKRDHIDAKAVTQLLGYVGQIERLVVSRVGKRYKYGSPILEKLYSFRVGGWLVGNGRWTELAERAIRSNWYLSYVPYRLGANGLISFDTDTATLVGTDMGAKIAAYNAPDVVGHISEAVDRTLRNELKEEGSWEHEYGELYQSKVSGRDYDGRDPDDAIEVWSRKQEGHELRGV